MSDATMQNEGATLDEFIQAERAALEAFAAMWREGTKQDPSKWPERMTLGEWDEQYRVASYD